MPTGKNMSAKSIDYKRFIAQQLECWAQAKSTYDSLAQTHSRQLDLGDCVVTLQHNPARVRSSTAKIDKASIAQRGCFLCREARPKEQLFIEEDGYELLVNPYPIFPDHLTIALAHHEPQRVAGRMHDMVKWAEMLEAMTVFYNGARCGASAPDHMHFQAAATKEFPVWRWIDTDSLPESPAYILCHSADEAENILEKLPHRPEEEPDVNILARSHDNKIDIAIIPRRKHRPSCYGTEGEGCVLLSPASVDMGGVWVLPREYDYRTLTAAKLKDIICETAYKRSEL